VAPMIVMIVNVGSTSLKFRVLDMDGEREMASGKIDRIGAAGKSVFACKTSKRSFQRELGTIDYAQAVKTMLDDLTDEDHGVLKLEHIRAIGFKTVHARGISDTTILDDDAIARMEDYVSVAPAHNPPYLKAIRIFRELLPETPLVGVFEAHFHKTIPLHLGAYALPLEFYEQGLRKYGFHGASHHFISERVGQILPSARRVISCHLGGSSSLCAILDGESLDTSMGFSPQSGMPQGTRCGDIDSYVMIHLMKDKGYSLESVEKLFGEQAGLLGMSGVSAEMSDILAVAAAGNASARIAIDVYCASIKKYIGAYAALLGGVDAVVFTGGIGENAADIRRRVLEGLEFLGVELDEKANQAPPGERLISLGKCRVYVIPANEEIIVARETVRALASRMPAR